DYAAAAATATLKGVQPSRVVAADSHRVLVRMRARTRVFGTLVQTLRVPVDTSAGVVFSGTLLFPGLRPGETLHRETELGARGAILADDGTPLAQGPGRISPIPQVAGEIVGRLGPIPAAERRRERVPGYLDRARAGGCGLELVFGPLRGGGLGGPLFRGAGFRARG